MAVQHLVYKTPGNEVIAVFDTTAKANTFAAQVSSWAVTSVNNEPDVDVGWWVTDTVSPGAVSETPPAAITTAAVRTTWRSDISSAYLTFVAQIPFWRETAAVSTTISASLTATVKWGVHQAAMASQLASATPLFASLTAAQRSSLIEHILDALNRFAGTVLADFEGDATKRGNWAGVSIADGAAIHTDLASSTGTERNRDGTFTALSGQGSTIPSKFTPENPSLS